MFFLIYFLIFYLIITCLVWYFQTYLMFHPERLRAEFVFEFNHTFEEINIYTDFSTRINGILWKTDLKSKGLIFYFKGNTRSIKGWSKFALPFLNHGYDVCMFDYPGFGKSTGGQSEESFYLSAEIMYHELRKKYESQDIIVYARSIGAGFGAFIASHHHVKKLILDSPYYDFYSLAKRYFFWLPLAWICSYKIPVHAFVQRCECPVFIIHGINDWIIPLYHSKKIKRKKPSVQLIQIKDAGHNNLLAFEQYHLALNNIL